MTIHLPSLRDLTRDLAQALRKWATRNASRRVVCPACRCVHREDRHV